MSIVKEIIKDAGIGFLATCDKGQPRVRPMSNYISKDGVLWFPTFRSSRKVGQLSNNSKVEVSFMDKKFQHVRIEAVLNVTDDNSKRKELWDDHQAIHNYFEGPEDPEYVILEIVPSKIECMAEGSTDYVEYGSL